MTTNRDDPPPDAGSSTDPHVTGSPETGDFVTDDAPAASTPSHGSSNAGLNAVHEADSPANQQRRNATD